jgi:acyl-CoA thioester hydrolase
MSTMHYFGMFDPACWHLLSIMGFTRQQMNREGRGFVDVRSTIEYRAEQHAGDLIVIDGGLLRIGSSSLNAFYRMKNSETGELAATLDSVTVYFDLATRQKVSIPDAIRQHLQTFIVDKDAA